MIVAMAGSAIGLGNIWRFPYLVGENGGAAFLFIYLAIVIVVCLPLLMTEFVIGKRGKANAVGSFRNIAPGTKWHLVGAMGVLAAFVLMSMYCVIGGWSANYLVRSLGFQFNSANSPDFDAIFSSSVQTAWPPVFYMLVFLAITAVVILAGVKNGIEKSCKVMMPLLFVLMIIIAIYAMTLPGAEKGLRYLFKPDFSKVTGHTVIAALGQAFFSLTIGMGGMITYASYADPDESGARCSLLTAVFDTVFAIIAGCVVMPAVFALGDGNPGSGPGLVFKALPMIFEKMPGGGIVSIFFFLSVLLAALTSAFSLVEVVLAYMVEEFRIKRATASAILFPAFAIIGTLCSLSLGAKPGIRLFGLSLFDLMDYFASNILLTVGSLLMVIFLGWKLGKKVFVEEITNYGKLKISNGLTDIIFFLIKYIIPVMIALIIAFSL